MLSGGLIGVLLIFAMGVLFFGISLGRGNTELAGERGIAWFAVLARSDTRWIAGLARRLAKLHRVAISVLNTLMAAATWLLGR